MEKCGILDALKYIEDLHSQIPSKDWKGKRAVGDVFTQFNKDRVELQRAAGFAGAKPLTVYKPVKREDSQTEEDNSGSSVESVVPESLKDIDNGELNAIIQAYSKKCEG